VDIRLLFTEHRTPSSHHSTTDSIFTINFTNLQINISQANIFGIQKFDHWSYLTTGGIFDFHTNFKTKWRTYKKEWELIMCLMWPSRLLRHHRVGSPRRRTPLTPQARSELTFWTCLIQCRCQSSHSTWFDLPNNVWGWEQNMKLLTEQLPPFSCYFLPLWSKYFPHGPVLKRPLSLMWDRNHNYASCFVFVWFQCNVW
jgi:hypothetical protein